MGRLQALRRCAQAVVALTLVAGVALSGAGTVLAGEPGPTFREPPPEHTPVRGGPGGYYFHAGRFYRKDPARGLVPARAPVGAVVAALPLGVFTVVVGGVTYYVWNDVYYRKVPKGYVVVEAPPPPPGPPPAGIAAVQTPVLNVRSGPGTTHPVIGQVRLGERLPILGSVPGWYQVRLRDGSHGWIMRQFTTVEQLAAG